MIKIKANFMIFLIITSIFSIHLISPVYAENKITGAAVSGSVNFCCEKTTSGEYCQYTSSSNCDNSKGAIPASCSYTDFCAVGCCVIDGACTANTPKAACEGNGGAWSSQSCSELQQCQTGCCIIGNDYTFTTETKCKKLYAPFPELQFQFRSDIKTEQVCLNQALAKEEGCCALDSDTFTYTTRSQCLSLTKNDASKFSIGRFCSAVPNSICKARDHKGCLLGKDDVYYFDSCGNPEEPALDCDYNSGTTCGQEENSEDFSCISVDCPNSPYGSKKNGESWCEYDGEEQTDNVGSRNFRRSCFDGKIIYEECADFRTEVCIEGTNSLGFSEGKCVKNDGSVPPGARFWQGTPGCSAANEEMEFPEEADEAIQQWVDAKYIQCTSIGDCGNKDNYVGDAGSGYSNSCGVETSEAVDARKAQIAKTAQIAGAVAGAGAALLGLAGVKAGLFTSAVTATYANGATATFTGTGFTAAGAQSAATASGVQAGALASTETGGVVGAQAGIEVTSSAAGATFAPLAALFAFLIIAAIIATIVALLINTLGEIETITCTATCNSWSPPSGGENCGQCTDDINKPCTEYRCRSLGAACRILNENTQFAECTAIAENDANSPIISPLPEVLSEGYSISESQNGYNIEPKVPAYTAIRFGIATDEPSQCKIDIKREVPFDKMIGFFGSQFYKSEHNLTFSLPAEMTHPKVLEATGGTLSLFVKCQDYNGNANPLDYEIKMTVLPGPDLTPPIVELTSIDNKAQLPITITSTEFSAFLNEPAECKYSDTVDMDFDQMTKTFTCATSFLDATNYGLYECKTTLSDIKHNQNNNYYIRCKDQPLELDQTKRNTNSESYIFTLRGTGSLNITRAVPVGDLTTSSPKLEVTTSGGAENGKAQCGFRSSLTQDFVKFYQTNFQNHQQQLQNLAKGSYRYYIKCLDVVGNTAETSMAFNIVKDISGPVIQSIVTQGDSLIITLSEIATCQYSSNPFSFGSGKQTAANTTTHSVPKADTVFMVCRDTSSNDVPFTIYP
ncbi:MAG: hypothetical protein HYS32_02525 [Candidatus Woesearchaeota archaeon]|nr:MAG: hypothetical protein HYS32_02525 [Candidatus Woesearchaeota archaeon]